jgi:hypothetical protein
MLGSSWLSHDGWTRRETLTAGALPLLGGLFDQSQLLARERTRDSHVRPGKAKSVILLYLQGGPPTQDMFDLKPSAPSGIRSEFKPIPTSAPGVSVCELLPETARWMHKAAVVRTVHHNGGCHNNLPMYTGYDVPPPDIESSRATDPPGMGSVCAYLQTGSGKLPSYVCVPCGVGWGEHKRKPGSVAGFLGQRFDPLCTECVASVDHPPDVQYRPQVVRGEPRLVTHDNGAATVIDALDQRRSLLQQLDGGLRRADSHALQNHSARQDRAFNLLTSGEVRSAFDLSREPDRLRERFGRTLFGASALLARRLVERGVRFVNVSWDNFSNRYKVSGEAWDTHENNFAILRSTHLPGLDRTYSALMEDLDARGLLDETLVVTMGEMGRTPRVNDKGGRDHWTFCYSVMLAGAGIRGGSVYGTSDGHAAYIKDKPVHIRDIVATIYHCLGIDPETPVQDHAGRPMPVAHGGHPIADILG